MIKIDNSSEFYKELKSILNLPKEVKTFKLILEPNSAVVVELTKLVTKDESKDLFELLSKYELVEKLDKVKATPIPSGGINRG